MANISAAVRLMTRPAARLSAASRCVSNPQPPKHEQIFAEVRERLFQAYVQRTPSFVQAVDLLTSKGGEIHNDHMALRSFVDSQGRSGLKFFESIFEHFSYAAQDSLVIPGLCVNARWYEPPEETNWPKIFVSEMRINELPSDAADVLFRHVDGFYEPDRAVAALESNDPKQVAELLETPPWNPTIQEMQTLRNMAADPSMGNALEYASWTLTHGHRINHVTILLNSLGISGVNTLADLNALLQSNGLVFNRAGGSDGLTQGSPAVSLEQSSTMADEVPHRFGCGTEEVVPCSFLELIQRHAGFRGFLGQNAKGIFASTNARASSASAGL